MTYDLLIRGGTLIDPAQQIHARCDVAFTAGRVAAVGADLPARSARETIDATGYLVTPGLIDLHVHVYPGAGLFGIDPDPTCLVRGATTVLDAGSAGAYTIAGFRRCIVERSQTRVRALLNASILGLLCPEFGEFETPAYADVTRACLAAEQQREVVLGIKVRLTRGVIVSERSGMLPLYRAREMADALGLPLMVHPQVAWCETLDDVLPWLRAGDLVTHCFHSREVGILDEQGLVRPAVREARARGILFDVGHGGGSFGWPTAERARDQGFLPDTISTDLHVYSLPGPVYDLPTTVSKFLALGLSLDEALARVTEAPARAFPAFSELGRLSVGAPGDAVVFELQTGEFRFQDSYGAERSGRQLLVPVAVVKAGRSVSCG